MTSIGLFSAIGETNVPADADFVRSSGYSAAGTGSARYMAVEDTGQAETAWLKRSADGRLWRIAETTIQPEMLGALGDNTTDDTAAFNAAVTLGLPIELGKGVTYRIAGIINLIDHTVMRGGGTLRGEATKVLAATGVTGIELRDFSIICAGSGLYSNGVYLIDCSQCDVMGLTVSNHRQYGIVFSGASLLCRANGNTFLNAATNPDFGQSSASDIQIEMNAQKCSANDNFCNSGGGYGIQIRNYRNSGVQHCDYHTVIGNIVDGYNSYGIMLYRDGPYDASGQPNPAGEPDLTVYGCVVADNIVRNISGSRPVTPGGNDYTQGCGIYIQGAERWTVSGGHISNTHSGSVAFSELLAPGAIGLANCGFGAVTGVAIRDAGYCGVYINDSLNLGASAGAIKIKSVVMSNVTREGIFLAARSNISIEDCDVLTTVRSGVMAKRGSGGRLANISIARVNIYDAGLQGFGLADCDNLSLAGNLARRCAGDNYSIATCSEVSLRHNRALDVAGRAFNLQASNTGYVELLKNRCTGNSGASFGYVLSCPVTTDDNVAAGFTSAYAGTYASTTAVTTGSAVELGGRKLIDLNYPAAETVTDFTNVVLGQREGEIIVVRFETANVTVQHGAAINLRNRENRTFDIGTSLMLCRFNNQWREVGGNTDLGWTAGTGTANKAAFSTYAGQTISVTPTAAQVQTLDNAARAASQRIKALEDAMRKSGVIS